MNSKILLIGSSAIGVLLVIKGLLSARSPRKKTINIKSSYLAVEEYLEEQMRQLNIPGVSLAVVEGDQIVHLRGFGHARPGGEAPTPQTPFLIGSLTKSFTALAIMQLVEAGEVELDAPVQRYLPWFRVADPVASTQMTVRHLLNQTSGLSNSVGEIILADFDQSPRAAERQARDLSSVELAHPVGSAFEYCNSNYQLLGLIIEAVSRETYADYIQAHIFNPLGMKHSFTSKEAAQQDGLAMGHQYWFMTPIAASKIPIARGAQAGGFLISSAEDLAHYLIAHLNGGCYENTRILSEAGIRELHRGPEEINFKGVSFRYGMGWFNSDLGPMKLIWHSGTVPDFFAYMGFMPEQKKGVVILFNACHHHMNVVLSGVGMNVSALLAGGQPGPSPFESLPWEMRNQAIVPAIQIIDIAATLCLLRRWRDDPGSRPEGVRKWGLHILLPMIHYLLVARTLSSMLGSRRDYLRWYMPDYSWIATICGGLALVWSIVRTGLILHTLRKT